MKKSSRIIFFSKSALQITLLVLTVLLSSSCLFYDALTKDQGAGNLINKLNSFNYDDDYDYDPDSYYKVAYERVYSTDFNGINGFTFENQDINDISSYSFLEIFQTGDFNGDGFDDLFCFYKTNDNKNLNVKILLGKNSFNSKETSFDIIITNISTDSANSDIIIADINNDNKADIVVSSKYNYEVDIIFGTNSLNGETIDAAGMFDAIQGFKIILPDSYPNLIISDFNGDGINDFIFGDYSYNLPAFDAGHIIVYFGKTSYAANEDLNTQIDGSKALEITGNSEDDYFADEIYLLGDENNDGIDNILVTNGGGPTHDNNNKSYILTGDTPAIATTTINSLLANIKAADVSSEVSFHDIYKFQSIGDIWGHGYSAYSIYRIYSENDSTISDKFIVSSDPSVSTLKIYNYESSSYGNFVMKAGDINSDGISDILLDDTVHETAIDNNNDKKEFYEAILIYGNSKYTSKLYIDDLKKNTNSLKGYCAENIQVSCTEEEYHSSDSSILANFDLNADGINDILIYNNDQCIYSDSENDIYEKRNSLGKFFVFLSSK